MAEAKTKKAAAPKAAPEATAVETPVAETKNNQSIIGYTRIDYTN